jgi:hypothetical protein
MSEEENIGAFLDNWIKAWNRHDLAEVLRCMADDVVFEHWNGRVIQGKRLLEVAWRPWFAAHGDFCFTIKSLCIDRAQQTFSFEWLLEWPSPEPGCLGERELREGIDYIRMREGMVISKRSYTKTALKIGGRCVTLKA